MKQFAALGCLMLLILINPAYARAKSRPALDKVLLRVSSEQWVTTHTAKVRVSIYATLGKNGLAKARDNIMKNLNRIAQGDWHITRFNRSQDSSGLERLSVMAEARLSEKILGNLRSNAKSVSKPGATYRISNIDFTPSLPEFEKKRSQVREMLYSMIKDELSRVNKKYPEQKYSVKSINFIGAFPPVARQAYKRARAGLANVAMEAPAAAAIAVSNKVRMTATAMLASNRNLLKDD